MSRSKSNRILAFGLACAISLPLAACSNNNPVVNKEAGPNGDGKLFTQPAEISLTISSHPSWPYNSDWIIWKYIEESTGAKLKIQAIPSVDYQTKLSLMMASPDTLPDMVHSTVKSIPDQYAPTGAFVSLSDNENKLPDMYKFLDTLPETERAGLIAQRKSGDGKMYSAPAYGTNTVNNIRTWMYREDIFKKHNLRAPTNLDELYQVAKKLKQLYPNSYPLCLRYGLPSIDWLAPLWAPYMSLNAYYDYTDKTWKYGPLQPEMKAITEFFIKMSKEGLVPPDFLTIDTKSWEELMSTDRGFISFDYVVRLDFFNLPCRKENPDYTLGVMAPPKGNTEKAQSKMTKGNIDLSGYMICNTQKQERIDNAFKLLNWMYTDEACELLSWGKKGETYEDKNGKKSFILGKDETPQVKYGIATIGSYERMLSEANEATYSKEQVGACHKALNYLEQNTSPLMWMPLKDDEAKIVADLNVEIGGYFEENISKFMLGQKPMSEWDTFQKTLKEMGVDELLSIYSKAYNRILG